MIINREETFSIAQANVRAAATYISTDVIDLTGEAPTAGEINDFGTGAHPMYLVIRIGAAYVGGTNITFNLVSSAAEALTTPTIHLTTGAIATAQLTANQILFQAPLPLGNYLRYLGLQYISTGIYSAGTHDAFLTMQPQRSLNYRSGFALPSAV